MLSLRKSGMDTLSPDKLSLLLLSRKPIQPTLSPPECWWLEPRGISSPASEILEIVASLASTNPRNPCPRPELALLRTCKQTIMNCKYWVCRSITCSSQRQVHLLPDTLVRLVKVQQSPLGLRGPLLCCRVALIFCKYSSTIFFTAERVLIYGLSIIWRLSC